MDRVPKAENISQKEQDIHKNINLAPKIWVVISRNMNWLNLLKGRSCSKILMQMWRIMWNFLKAGTLITDALPSACSLIRTSAWCSYLTPRWRRTRSFSLVGSSSPIASWDFGTASCSSTSPHFISTGISGKHTWQPRQFLISYIPYCQNGCCAKY